MLRQMPRLTILHLSDLHYGNDSKWWAIWNKRGYNRRPSAGVIKGLEGLIREIRPNYVIISGDFVNKAKQPCFSETALFLRDLFLNSGINIQEQLLVVPGNHDAPFSWKKKPD